MSIRVRFAPSPTGKLHLGNARAALYNWLFARHHGDKATFVLRIEDTDQERSTAEAVDQALRVLHWLGLDWDEGPEVEGPYAPYFQTQRVDTYDKYIEQLLAEGKAYNCYCSTQEIAAERAACEAEKRPVTYSGRCRELSTDQIAAFVSEGRLPTVRLRLPDTGTTIVDDIILGATKFENALLGDFIIRRSNGLPIYNFAVVIDDAEMKITDVIRGADHLSNTPRQILIYEALGLPVPTFAHAPMILGPDKKKLGKRHGAASVEDLAQEGYIPAAVRNYLALLGWNKDGESSVMTTEDIVEHFDIARVSKSPAVFDYAKLRSINGSHLRMISPAEFAAEYDTWRNRWIEDDTVRHEAFAATPDQAAFLVQEKVDVLADVPALIGFLAEPFVIGDDAWSRLTAFDEAADVLSATITALENLDDFTLEAVEGIVRGLVSELELKPKVVFGSLRFAVTGRPISPGLFESIVTLGRERTLERLASAHECLSKVPTAST